MTRNLLLLFLAISLASAAHAQSPCEEDRVDVADIPLVERPAAGGGDRFAVVVTGDGGWRRIDAKIADRLRSDGVPVVGFLASSYFRSRKTPEQSACALERIIRRYSLQWKRNRVILIGYSRGADVLPFLINRLPADLRARVALIALLGLEPMIDFEYHPMWDLRGYFHHAPQFPVRPEVEKLRGQNVLCVFGAKESDSLCPSLDPQAFTILREPGGHHFDGRYDEIGAAILRQAK